MKRCLRRSFNRPMVRVLMILAMGLAGYLIASTIGHLVGVQHMSIVGVALSSIDDIVFAAVAVRAAWRRPNGGAERIR